MVTFFLIIETKQHSDFSGKANHLTIVSVMHIPYFLSNSLSYTCVYAQLFLRIIYIFVLDISCNILIGVAIFVLSIIPYFVFMVQMNC